MYLGTHLSGDDGQPHPIVGLVQLNHVDIRLTAWDGHGPVTHHTGAPRLQHTHTHTHDGLVTSYTSLV